VVGEKGEVKREKLAVRSKRGRRSKSLFLAHSVFSLFGSFPERAGEL